VGIEDVPDKTILNEEIGFLAYALGQDCADIAQQR
jgi:hypothetical protein